MDRISNYNNQKKNVYLIVHLISFKKKKKCSVYKISFLK